MSKAYQSNEYTIPPGYENPTGASPAGGCQQATSCSVIGNDASVTVALDYQGIGLAPVSAGLTPYDGDIP
jgi:hypothetical protein